MKTQFGRCFVLNGNTTLSAGTDWESALENLTIAELQKFVQRHNLVIPADTQFLPLADLFLNDPNKLIATYRQGEALEAELTLASLPVNPAFPTLSDSKPLIEKEEQVAPTNL